MKNKVRYLFLGVIVILLVAAVMTVLNMNNRYNVIEDLSEVKKAAQELYAGGDTQGAIAQMETYCTHNSLDIEAKTLLGDWYYETGNEKKAYECYAQAASSKQHGEEKIASLTVKNNKEIILEPVQSFVIEITPDVRVTKNMTLTITSSNLAPQEHFEGKIEDNAIALTEEDNYYTTAWFDVDPDGEYLTMSGGFNCAIWQFKDENGIILTTAESTNIYRKNNNYDVDVYQMARVVIPDESAMCRVTYFNKNQTESTASPDEELTIVYGRLPGESVEPTVVRYEIPDLNEGEKIVFENNQWKMIDENGETLLTEWEIPVLERGSYVTVGGDLPGKVSFEKSEYATFDEDGIYTIRFDSENPSAMGKRMDDATNLGFNAAVGEGTIALGENHFDSIYPWKDMKLCNIKDGNVICYEGEESFSVTGSNGDVFVEIPKFYVRRVVDGRYDTISISGTEHEDFEVDEAFVTENGTADKIYVAAYLTSVDSAGDAVSYANVTPVLSMTANELVDSAKAKGNGYREIDYAALSCIQKLFMVETGLRNSQYLYLGSCAYTLAEKNAGEEGYIVSLNDSAKSNCIVVSKAYNFEEGNNVVLFDATDYENTIEAGIADTRKVKTVIDDGNGIQSVYFDGEPVNIKKGVTAIAHIALVNGTTRSVSAHTGAISTSRGTVSFKYRNIENLWGNAYVYIDGLRVKNGIVTVDKRQGNTITLAYPLPDVEGLGITSSMVRRVGCDPEYPQILLPSHVGEGATTSTFYGDAFISNQEPDKEYVVHYGGAWNSRACAGLFAYTVNATADESYINTTGRMMLIK